jgi:hypothetical protein
MGISPPFLCSVPTDAIGERSKVDPERGRMGLAQNIALYNSAYRLAWKHVSEIQKREKPNLASRLHDSIRREISKGATEPLFIASEALRDVEFNPETWD